MNVFSGSQMNDFIGSQMNAFCVGEVEQGWELVGAAEGRRGGSGQGRWEGLSQWRPERVRLPVQQWRTAVPTILTLCESCVLPPSSF